MFQGNLGFESFGVSEFSIIDLCEANIVQFDSQSLEFNNNPSNGTDVLQDFDFDSFLHQDVNDNEPFNFDPSGLEFDGIGAE